MTTTIIIIFIAAVILLLLAILAERKTSKRWEELFHKMSFQADAAIKIAKDANELAESSLAREKAAVKEWFERCERYRQMAENLVNKK